MLYENVDRATDFCATQGLNNLIELARRQPATNLSPASETKELANFIAAYQRVQDQKLLFLRE